MRLTNEQIQAILDGAPDSRTHIDSVGFYHDNDGRDLNDLREILQLRKEVGRLRKALIESQDWDWLTAKEESNAPNLGYYEIPEMQALHEIAHLPTGE